MSHSFGRKRAIIDLGPLPLQHSEAYNYAVAIEEEDLPPEFSAKACFDGVGWARLCVYHRPGTCQPKPEQHINMWMKRNKF
jgi:hypothetical protein